ncbi:hypothetical protein [Vermiculatibacterium agrestimuris]|uniref:hypothetical protein n=1 Tax=Vermiculatibacterium agrestimuris TaxID=2941519 RepID=UPI0020400E35|nr:hypothetical protein [Vermiculatibacterium agrestimuris]
MKNQELPHIQKLLFFLCPVLLLVASPWVRDCTLKCIQRDLPGAGAAFCANIALAVLPILLFAYILFIAGGKLRGPFLLAGLVETLLLLLLPLTVKWGPVYSALMKTGAVELHVEFGCILLGMLALAAFSGGQKE